MHKFLGAGLAVVLFGVILAACGQAPSAGPAASNTSAQAAAQPTAATAAKPSAAAATGGMDKVTVQLKWVAQAQFAGYYAALDQGFYKAEGLDVTIRPGGPDIAPEQVVASGQAEFGLD